MRARTDESKIKTAKDTNTARGYTYITNSLQTRNNGEVVRVERRIVDDTEGLGAIDSLYFSPHTRNLDIGGGKFEDVSLHLLLKYFVLNLVYDPYNRTDEHNESVLTQVATEPVDSVTSIGVLNVILEDIERAEHIRLAYDSLRKGGMAFFKVYRGNGSGIAVEAQSNKDASCYLDEVKKVFGEDEVDIPEDNRGNTILAFKK